MFIAQKVLYCGKWFFTLIKKVFLNKLIPFKFSFFGHHSTNPFLEPFIVQKKASICHEQNPNALPLLANHEQTIYLLKMDGK